MLFSCLGIIIAIYFKGKYFPSKSNFFVWVGKNSIWFYFAQGVSSSIIYNFVDFLQYVWYIKLFLCISINVCITIVIVFVVKSVYNYIEKGFGIIVKNRE